MDRIGMSRRQAGRARRRARRACGSAAGGSAARPSPVPAAGRDGGAAYVVTARGHRGLAAWAPTGLAVDPVPAVLAPGAAVLLPRGGRVQGEAGAAGRADRPEALSARTYAGPE